MWESWQHNRPYWIIMFITGVLLLSIFAYDSKEIIKLLLTWTFAVSSHKIFIDDIALRKLRKNQAFEKKEEL